MFVCVELAAPRACTAFLVLFDVQGAAKRANHKRRRSPFLDEEFWGGLDDLRALKHAKIHIGKRLFIPHDRPLRFEPTEPKTV